MRTRWMIAASLAAVAAASAVVPQPAAAGAWPIYHYYGYDPTYGYYGSPSSGPAYLYVPPKVSGYSGPVCVWRKVYVAGQWQLACY